MKPTLAPLTVHALRLSKPTEGNGPLCDFSALPYVEKTSSATYVDRNSDVPWVGGSVTRDPLAPEDTPLAAGVHVHWEIPKALRGVEVQSAPSENQTFPQAPDRWLVTRWVGGDAKASWVIESDYLWAPGAEPDGDHVGYPYRPGRTGQDPSDADMVSAPGPSWRPMGRTRKLDPTGKLPSTDGTGDYLNDSGHKLTAVGYGDPHFAAYYPSCRSVFGLHDPDPPDGTDVVYEICGWSSDPADPAVYIGAIAVPGAAAPLAAPEVTVAFGEDRVAAFATLLSQKVGGAPDERAEIEVFVESLLVVEDLDDFVFDAGPRLEAGLHSRRFTPTSGGTTWRIATATAETSKASAREAAQAGGGEPLPSGAALPPLAAHALRALNDAQRALDAAQAHHDDEALRLYLDWCRYQRLRYPDPDTARRWGDAAPGHSLPIAKAWMQTEAARVVDSLSLSTSEAEALVGPVDAVLREAVARLETLLDRPPPEDARPTPTALDALAGGIASRYGEGPEEALSAPEAASAFQAVAQAFQAIANGLRGEGDRVAFLTGLRDVAKWFTEAVLKVAPHPAPKRTWSIEAHRADAFVQPALPAVAIDGLPEPPPPVASGNEGDRPDGGDLDPPEVKSGTSFESFIKDVHAKLPPPHAPPASRPLFFEWEAEVTTVEGGAPGHADRWDYAPTAVRSRYAFGPGSVDFALEAPATATPHLSVCRGRGLLTPGPEQAIGARLKTWAIGRLRPHAEALGVKRADYPGADAFDDALYALLAESHRADLEKVFPAGDPIYRAVKVRSALEASSIRTQTLEGFNDALLTRRPDAYLPIDDPLGFADDREFAKRVHDLVGGSHPAMPDPISTFLPLRDGAARLRALNLVDAWGRVTSLPTATIEVPTRAQGADGALRLRPRLMQPARLAADFLEAAPPGADRGPTPRLGLHPGASAVCGWVLPNLLDGSVEFFGPDGAPGGTVGADGEWREAPGGAAVRPSDLAHPALTRVADWLATDDAERVGAFSSVVEAGLETIDPWRPQDQRARALLYGRPMAVVRLRLGIELRDRPASDLSMDAFFDTLTAWYARATGATDAAADQFSPSRSFEHVQLPLRIGEPGRLQDGVVGYWVESGGALGPTFWAPHGGAAGGEGVHPDTAPGDEGFVLWRTPTDAPTELTVLLDPHASVHITTGVLPTATLSLAPDVVERALGAISVTFLSAPVLGPPGRAELPLPEVAGREWAWLANEGGRWTRRTRTLTVSRAAVAAAFPALLGLWDALVKNGCLTPVAGHPDRAALASAKDADVKAALAAAHPASGTAPTPANLLRGLAAIAEGIAVPSLDAHFAPGLSLHEGWLQLSPDS